MKKMLMAAAASAAFLSFSAPASAAVTIDLGTLNAAGDFGLGGTIASPGEEYNFVFSLSQTLRVLSQMQASTFSLSGGGFITTPQLINYSLYSGTPGAETFLSTSPLAFASVAGQTLAAGNYFLRVETISANNEFVTGGVFASAVPEPATWATMILGFFGLGAVLRRRKALPVAANA